VSWAYSSRLTVARHFCRLTLIRRVRNVRAFASILTTDAAVPLTVACSSRTALDGPAGAVLTYNDVTALAVDAAKTGGTDVAEYSPPVLSFDTTKSQDQWRAKFTLKDDGRPGGHFIVLVDDHTKRTRYLPGE
jgi:hypothetical protein